MLVLIYPNRFISNISNCYDSEEKEHEINEYYRQKYAATDRVK